MINLVERYYTDNNNYPTIIKSVIQRMRVYITDLLYADDTDIDDDGVSPRVIIADIGASTDEGIRRATEEFGSNQDYPFTAYGIGEYEVVLDRKNSMGATSLYYDSTLDTFVNTIPIKQELLAMTFTNDPDDEERIKKIMFKEFTTHTLIYADVEMNSGTYQLPIRVEAIPTKGQYAHAFLEYLRINQIYDVVHNFNLYFQDIVLDTDTTPIDTMTLGIEEKSPIDDSLNIIENSSSYIRADVPTVMSTYPEDEAIDIDVNSGVIITFNVTMDETYVENAITLDPYFEHNISWDDDSKVLTLTPKEIWDYETEYTINIADTARGFYVYDTLDETEFSFTTIG